MILKPLKFSGQVTRSLSRWCKEVPAIDVAADLEALEVSSEHDKMHGVRTGQANTTKG